MKTVKLEAIIPKNEIWFDEGTDFAWVSVSTCKAAMREACHQTIELCADNAEAYESVGDYPCVSRGSILNTKSQII